MIAYLAELAADLVRSLSVPDTFGRWTCHRWDFLAGGEPRG